jgi:hypothetical protein
MISVFAVLRRDEKFDVFLCSKKFVSIRVHSWLNFACIYGL